MHDHEHETNVLIFEQNITIYIRYTIKCTYKTNKPLIYTYKQLQLSYDMVMIRKKLLNLLK